MRSGLLGGGLGTWVASGAAVGFSEGGVGGVWVG
jgi:hypothetical protein